MQVTYRLENDDYRALARFLYYDSPRGRKVWRFHILLALVLSVGGACLVYVLSRDIVLAALYGAFCVVLMRVLRQRGAQVHINRIYQNIRPQDERRMKEPGTLTLLPEGLEAQYGKGGGTVPWRSVTQVGRDARHIFFILGKANAFAVPMREFESPEAFERFYQQACEYHASAFTAVAR